MDMENKNNSYWEMTEEEVDKLFEGCHSNLEAPIIGEIYTPICKNCKNLIRVNGGWSLPVCQELGRFPREYWEPDVVCPYRVPKK